MSRGVIFSLSTTGQFHFLHEFGCSIDGSGVLSGLTGASDGYLLWNVRFLRNTDGWRHLQDVAGRLRIYLAGYFQRSALLRAGPGMVQGSDGNLYGTGTTKFSFTVE